MVWQAGHLLNNGKYEIIGVLGRGSFGLTYKARHRQLVMEVVIKTPDILQKRDTEYEDYVKKFQAEGRKLAKFSQNRHPHIVSISDFFIEGQVPCLVMDFIQGQTLIEKVKAQGKLSEAECLKYIRQIGSALEAVHQAGMVHRDAHPGNIMIQPNGNAILIDFGIAKEIIPASSSSTNSGRNYFSPYEQVFEQYQSKDRGLENITDNRKPSVDIYTLAATFYYAVTAQEPISAFERKVNNRLLVPPKKINRNLSEHINTAIILGMALEKENRPQSISDWLQQLELPPPAVKPQYRQEKVNPSRSVKPEKEPEVAKQKLKVNRISAQNSVLGKLKNIPWGWLIGVFFIYGATGYTLGVNSAPWQVVAGVVAGAVALAGAVVLAWAVSWFLAWAVAWAVAVAVAFTVVGAGALAGAGGGALAGTEAVEELLKYFSRFHSFLILAGTNLSSLGSGWLLAFLLHPKG